MRKRETVLNILRTEGKNPNLFLLISRTPATLFYLLTIDVTEIYIYKGIQPVEMTENSNTRLIACKSF